MSRRVALVTGCAGFVGSHLVERLLAEGWRVRGVDAFTDYYPRAEKEENLADVLGDAAFELLELDLSSAALEPLLADRPVVFHLAAQPGVRGSFGEGFAIYLRDNVLATQRLLEAAVASRCGRIVWASSSSVYGDAAAYPCRERATPTAPRSPYGMTKRACEDLAAIYRRRGVDSVGLRYFTVYGPRQRPDMAMRRLCEAALRGETFPVYGDGLQVRDFTYVADVVDATVRAAHAATAPPILNVGGREAATLLDVIGLVERLVGSRVALERLPDQLGDVRRTGADTSLAREHLGWNARVALADGLAAMVAWASYDCRSRCIAASNATSDGAKSAWRTKRTASAAPHSRSIPLSSHSTESGPV
jgi:nucleoside-diphosphate-sugar epimerase